MPDMPASPLNENGRLICMMVATMAAGVLANPIRVERNEPNMDALAEMAMNFVQMVNANAGFQMPVRTVTLRSKAKEDVA